jgi:hypothetical protein
MFERMWVTRIRPGDMHPENGVVPEKVIVVDDNGLWAFPVEGEGGMARDMSFAPPEPSDKRGNEPEGRRERYKKLLSKP